MSEASRNEAITDLTPTRVSLTKRQWTILGCLALTNYVSGMVISLQAPFFPKEADKRGGTPTQYGYMFGIYELVSFIACPIYGKYIRAIGPKLMLNAGNLVGGTFCIFFGISDGPTFISLAFTFRIVEALGQAAFLTSSFAITAVEFSDTIASTFSLLETTYALGMITGPIIGGLLYEVGGFTLPFAAVGCVLLMSAIITLAILPLTVDTIETPSSYWKMLKIPAVLISYYSIVSASFTWGFLLPLLEPHLRQFYLSTSLVGAMFAVEDICYALSALVWGYLAGKRLLPKKITGCGAILIVTAFLLIGPAPFFPFKSKLWLVIIALGIKGAGEGAEYVAAYVDCSQTVISSGFPDNTETYGMLAGLWASGLALGGVFGPAISGMLSDAVGFAPACLFVCGVQTTVGLFNFGHLAYDKRCHVSDYQSIVS